MKCIVKDCKNHEHQGRFVGELCSPCHEFIVAGEETHSQMYRNTRRKWVGLTDEEKYAAYLKIDAWDDCVNFIDAKLKEKNDR